MPSNTQEPAYLRNPSLWLLHRNKRLEESRALLDLRLAEARNPAPFHNDRFWRLSDPACKLLFQSDESTQPAPHLGHVPLHCLMGVAEGHATGLSQTPTWGEVLFCGLHGAGVTEESIDFLVDTDTVKSNLLDPSDTCGYPQPPGLSVVAPEYVSKRGLEFEKFNDSYFCVCGQQRVVFARFALWHWACKHQLDWRTVSLTNVRIAVAG